jgi:2-aminoethylphosphonate-pyruvate transaminase
LIDTAIILAAGMGTRLRGVIDDQPKGLLRLGERPIVEESIELLREAGVANIVIVTGFCAEAYGELVSRHAATLRTVHNPLFAESGSMYSLYCARDAVSDDFLLLESDLIYEPRALTTLLQHPAQDAILLSGPSDAGDEVLVSTREGRLVNMSKLRTELGGEIAGELVGISKISFSLFRLMQRTAVKIFERSLRYDYETGCLVAVASQQAIACPIVPDLVWCEIDDAEHLRRARERIHPEIRRRIAAGA